MKISLRKWGSPKRIYITTIVEEGSTKIECDDADWKNLLEVAIEIARNNDEEKEILKVMAEELSNSL